MSEQPGIMIETSKGPIRIVLHLEEAPVTCENFLNYVRNGFYEQTIFHRVIPNFMIQGGGFTVDMTQKPGDKQIKNEADNGLKNLRGTLAMARTQVVDSATSQFFINLADNNFLDHQSKTPQGYGYAVFARVTEGMEVVDSIAKAATGNYGPHQDVPKEPILIERIIINE